MDCPFWSVNDYGDWCGAEEKEQETTRVLPSWCPVKVYGEILVTYK